APAAAAAGPDDLTSIDTMRRITGLLTIAACLFVQSARTGEAAPCRVGAPAVVCFLHPLKDAGGCKPGAPVAVQLAQTGAQDVWVGALQISITPRVEREGATWRLSLPGGAELVDGPASGSLEAGTAGTGPLHLRVRLPADAAFSRVELLVDA